MNGLIWFRLNSVFRIVFDHSGLARLCRNRAPPIQLVVFGVPARSRHFWFGISTAGFGPARVAGSIERSSTLNVLNNPCQANNLVRCFSSRRLLDDSLKQSQVAEQARCCAEVGCIETFLEPGQDRGLRGNGLGL